MDQQRFDSLAQRWAITLSRRDGHRMLGGALLGLLAVTAAPAVEAKKGKKKRCKKLFAACGKSKQCCGAKKKKLKCATDNVCAPNKYCCKPEGRPCNGDDCECCGSLECSLETNRCVAEP